MLGIAQLLVVAALMDAPAPIASGPDSLLCVRTTHWFPQVSRTVHCYSQAEFSAWQKRRRLEAQADDQRLKRLEQTRQDRRWQESRSEEERIVRAREERERYDRRLAERRHRPR